MHTKKTKRARITCTLVGAYLYTFGNGLDGVKIEGKTLKTGTITEIIDENTKRGRRRRSRVKDTEETELGLDK